MTKKIKCKVLDSTPLSPDRPELHFGWGFDTSIYPDNNDQADTHSINVNQRFASAIKDSTGALLDCLA